MTECIELGCYQWRVGISPLARFREAVEHAIAAFDLTSTFKKWVDPRWSRLEMAALAECFCGTDAFFGKMEALGDWAKARQMPQNEMKWLLCEVLHGVDNTKRWDQVIGTLNRKRTTKLFAESFTLYRDLIAASRSGNAPEVAVLVDKAMELYPRRKRSAGFYGFGFDGHGEDNDRVIDIYLGAVMKVCGITPPEGCIHAWRW